MVRRTNPGETQLSILRALLATPDHISVREVARQLRLPPGYVHHHLQRMVKMGILVKRSWTEEEGDLLKEYVEYEPQPIFSRVDEAVALLQGLASGIEDSSPEKIAHCATFLLRLRNSRFNSLERSDI